MGDALRRKLSDAGWVVANETVLPLVCFTHEDIRAGQLEIEAVVRLLQERGRVWISDVVLGQRERVLRACVTSFRTDEEDLDVLVGELEHARRHRRR